MVNAFGGTRDSGLEGTVSCVLASDFWNGFAARIPELPPRFGIAPAAQSASMPAAKQSRDACSRCLPPRLDHPRQGIISPFYGSAMEAERLNTIANTLADLEARSAELRRYL